PVAAKAEPPRHQPGPASQPTSVADSPSGSGDYLASLDAAFDSLDQQLSGGAPQVAKTAGRGPSPSGNAAGNPVFEVDDEWFSAAETQARADARARHGEI